MKSRPSFIKAITNRLIRKADPQSSGAEDVKEEPIKIKEESHERSYIKKGLSALSSSFEVSFNLDKLYFDDDDEPKEETKNQNVQKQEEPLPEIPLFNCTNQNQQAENIILRKEEHQETKLLKNEPEPIQNCQQPQTDILPLQLEKSQEEEEPIIQELDKTISIEHLRVPCESRWKDKSVQEDYGQEDTGLSPYQTQYTLSQIDMLFLNPLTTNKYSLENPLIVTIQELARLYPLDLTMYHFVKLHPQASSEKQIKLYKAFMQDWKKSLNRSGRKKFTLAKMRTVIVRDAMNALVDSIAPPIDTEDYHLRISKTYRSRYIKAGIPIPPPRVNNSYLQNIFSKPKIKNFYMKYINERLDVYLQEENFMRIEIYTLEIMKCLHLAQNKMVEELIQILNHKKKPFTNKQLQSIVKEAHQIANDYGNCKKRIGNGHSRKAKVEPQPITRREYDDSMNSMNSKPSKKVKTQQKAIDQVEEIIIQEETQQKQEEYITFSQLQQKRSRNVNKEIARFLKRELIVDSSQVQKREKDQSDDDYDFEGEELQQSFTKSFSKSFSRGMKLN